MEPEEFSLKRFIFGSISRKITILFIMVGVVAPTIGIALFYVISVSMLPVSESELFAEQTNLLLTAAAVIIALIAADAGFVGFLVSRSISKPIKTLHQLTQEIEKGNFTVRTDIKTADELEQLGRAFNSTTEALSRMDEERRQIDHAKTEFLSITSHELRTPMTPMKAQLQMLENEYFGKLSKQQKDSLEVVLRNADRLDKIIVDFLEISRIEAARLKFVFKETDLHAVLQETVQFMSGFAKEKNIDLVIDTQKLPIIEVDPDRLSQILRNLISNAIKFSNENSKIIIHAEKQDDHILFSIKDFGAGLTPENQIQVFEPFYQVEKTLSRKHGGTGLGLAICRGIVESQKGRIWAESEGPDKGTTFHFTIPITPVRDIEPIKVLFSAKSDLERKIKDAFTSTLGPMGTVEFETLKNRNALWKDDLIKYIDTLTKQGIINNIRREEFKHDITTIFGEEQKNKVKTATQTRPINQTHMKYEKVKNL